VVDGKSVRKGTAKAQTKNKGLTHLQTKHPIGQPNQKRAQLTAKEDNTPRTDNPTIRNTQKKL
jgi:hypothetical protein